MGVETKYGQFVGHYRVLDALMTLAFDYPPRSDYFRGELEQFLLLYSEEHLDPLKVTGSYAGAMGVPQFMPSSYRLFAVDGNDDKKRDLWNDWDDILASIANYFVEHGWESGGPVLAETRLDPEPKFQIDTRNLELNETVDSLNAQGVEVIGTQTGHHAGGPDLSRAAGRAGVSGWIQEFLCHHALQPQRALCHGSARPGGSDRAARQRCSSRSGGHALRLTLAPARLLLAAACMCSVVLTGCSVARKPEPRRRHLKWSPCHRRALIQPMRFPAVSLAALMAIRPSTRSSASATPCSPVKRATWNAA